MKALLAVLLLVSGSLAGRSGEVTGGLHVPPAATRVIGDELPLVWFFTNQTAQPLAFMWEGCCRLNGNLTVKALGQDVATLPPGPSTAHQFPKAARLEPGRAGEFKTLLSDWVRLTNSGRYELQGSYVGIMPTQNPQVPPSLALWKGQTTTPPIELEVLDVNDYLAQRAEREQAQQVRLRLSGPAKFSLAGTSEFQLQLQNTGAEPRSLAWPQSVQLWLVDEHGTRAAGVSHYLAVPSRTITLAPTETVSMTFPLESRELVGIPLGVYQLFVELSEREGEPRVPSNPLQVLWQIDPLDVAGLLDTAARGPGAGLRNVPLMMLRTYLEDVGPILRKVTDTRPEVVRLARELESAACLKPVSPRPGRVDMQVTIDRDGRCLFRSERIAHCLPGADIAEQLAQVVSVRRHLGWVVHLMFEPHPQAAARVLFAAAATLQHKDLGGPATAAIPHPETGVPIGVHLQPQLMPANLVIRIRRADNGLSMDAARRLPDPSRPQLTALFTPDEVGVASFTHVPGAEEFESLLGDGKLAHPRVLVLVGADVTWDEVVRLCAPLLNRVTQFNLALS